jgi:hypothetical protein
MSIATISRVRWCMHGDVHAHPDKHVMSVRLLALPNAFITSIELTKDKQLTHQTGLY